jgi:hypothetical protein
MFTTTGAAGPKSTPPYVPDPIQVTTLMRNTTTKALSRSVSPKARASTVIGTTDNHPKPTPNTDNHPKPTPNTMKPPPTTKPPPNVRPKHPPTEQPMIANFRTKKLSNDTPNQTPIIEPIEKQTTNSEKLKKTNNPDKNNSISSNPAQKSTMETPEKSLNHPTRRFTIPPRPTECTPPTATAPTNEDLAIKTNDTSPPPFNLQSPMRTTPFTTPIIPKPSRMDTSNPTSKPKSTQAQSDTTEPTSKLPAGTKNQKSAALPILQAKPPSATQTPSPIKYYQDPSATIGERVPTMTEAAQHTMEADSPPPLVVQRSLEPHISEPLPLNQDEFPMQDDPEDPADLMAGTQQDSDAGYATATNDGMQLEADETIGTQSDI